MNLCLYVLLDMPLLQFEYWVFQILLVPVHLIPEVLSTGNTQSLMVIYWSSILIWQELHSFDYYSLFTLSGYPFNVLFCFGRYTFNADSSWHPFPFALRCNTSIHTFFQLLMSLDNFSDWCNGNLIIASHILSKFNICRIQMNICLLPLVVTKTSGCPMYTSSAL